LKEHQTAPRAAAKSTGDADATAGGIAVTGNVIGNINQIATTPIRNDYLQEIRRIVPSSLDGREAELASLAEFCTMADVPVAGQWWKGDAWAGKSALMSWFVLHPPPKTWIVSFFVTGRYGPRDDRAGFIQNVLEQLAVLPGDPGASTFPRLTESTADLHLLGIMSAAAFDCQARGERLILLVDGLDEDQGTARDPARSIAALLPDPPPAGMRVIVTGRPHPPVPADVPDRHWLRNPAVVRTLAVSPSATAVRAEMERALQRLLGGAPAQQDIVGLLTAARGGLSKADLAELIGTRQWELDGVLGTIAGRSFTTRPSSLLPGTRPEVYLLAHDELQNTATEFLGTALKTYRQRLHQWADLYRRRAWPEDTPEYLLQDYGRRVREQRDDHRLMTLAADGRRHDRMLAATGGDGNALAEINAALAATRTQWTPDLSTVARVVYQRDRILDRNANVPAGLAIAWARLGRFGQAEAIAAGIEGGISRLIALSEISGLYVEAGLAAEADRVLDEARVLIHGDLRADSGQPRIQHLGILAEGLARAGQADQAEAMIRTALDPSAKESLTIATARGLARAGFSDRAESLIMSIDDPETQAEALADVGLALASSDLTKQQAMRITCHVAEMQAVHSAPRDDFITVARAFGLLGEYDRAKALAESFVDLEARADALAEVAVAVLASGDTALAVSLAAEAETLLDDNDAAPDPLESEWVSDASPPWPYRRAIMNIAEVRAVNGELSLAQHMVRWLPDQGERADGLAGIATTLAAAGQTDHAFQVLAEADAMARGTATPSSLADALVDVSRAAAASGNRKLATEILTDIVAAMSAVPDAVIESFPIGEIAVALASVGDAEGSLRVARLIGEGKAQDRTLARAAAALSESGHYSQGHELTAAIDDPDWKQWASVKHVEALADTQLGAEAAELALTLPHATGRSSALIIAVAAAALSDQRDRVRDLVAAISDPGDRSTAVIRAASGFTRAGHVDYALQLVSAVACAGRRSEALTSIVCALAETGRVAEAYDLAHTVPDTWWRACALAYAAGAAGSTGSPARAEILGEVTACLATAAEAGPDQNAGFLAALGATIWAYTAAAEAFAKDNQPEQAIRLTGKIPHPGSRRRAISNVAVLLAEVGSIEQARKLVLGLPTPDRRARALAAMSTAARRSGHEVTAQRLMVSALETGGWTAPLARLGEVSPLALRDLAEEIREEFRRVLVSSGCTART
jgi:tetratricopeptide (TPR) repeat protein